MKPIFPKNNIIDEWLKENGDPEITKQVEREAEELMKNKEIMAKNNTKLPEKDIVSFDQALKLCSIGFDEPTFCMYEIENKQLCLCYLDEDGLYMPQKDFHAPTKGQVFRWFRNKYNVDCYITRILLNVVNRDIYHVVLNDRWAPNDSYKNYEDAESRLIDNLIELAKQKDNEK